MSQSVSVEWIARRREATAAHCCCSVQRKVVKRVHCNVVLVDSTVWLESLCRRRGRVVVVVDCSAVECDDCCSRLPTRDLHCLTTSAKATWRRWIETELVLHCSLHLPTSSPVCGSKPFSCACLRVCLCVFARTIKPKRLKYRDRLSRVNQILTGGRGPTG